MRSRKIDQSTVRVVSTSASHSLRPRFDSWSASHRVYPNQNSIDWTLSTRKDDHSTSNSFNRILLHRHLLLSSMSQLTSQANDFMLLTQDHYKNQQQKTTELQAASCICSTHIHFYVTRRCDVISITRGK